MKDKFIYYLILSLVRLLSVFPRRALKFCSDVLGLIWFNIDKRHRHLVIDNLKQSFPGEYTDFQIERMSCRIFKNIASIAFEVIWTVSRSKEELLKYVDARRFDIVQEALKKGNGVILLTAHLGNFEMLVPTGTKAGIKGFGIYRRFDFLPLEWLVRNLRERFDGIKMIPMGGLSRKIDTILNQNGIICTLFDQNAGWYNGVPTQFFNRPACTKKSLAKLVQRTKAAVVPSCIVRENDRYILEFFPQIPLEQTGCPIKDIEKNTQNYVSAVEEMVRKNTENYFWVHNRWKTRSYCMLSERPETEKGSL